MIRRPPRSTRTDTLFPYTTLFRSLVDCRCVAANSQKGRRDLTADLIIPRREVESFVAKCAYDVRKAAEPQISAGTRLCPDACNRRAERRIGERCVDQARRYSCRIRSEEHTSELQSLMRISYAVFC